MKTINPILLAVGLWIFCVCTGVAQNEGKHLGSTEDIARNVKTTHPGSAGDGSTVPQATTSGGRYGTGLYAAESGMYLFYEWKPGYVVLGDQSLLDDLLLRYDIYNQQIQFVSGGDTLAFSNPRELDYVYMEGQRFVYEKFIHDGVLGEGYFELLKEGDCQLLLRRAVTMHKRNLDIEGNTVDEYLREVSYYLKKGGEEACEVRLSWKNVLKALSDEEENVRKFMHDNELKMNCCQDLVRVLDFYNSLH